LTVVGHGVENPSFLQCGPGPVCAGSLGCVGPGTVCAETRVCGPGTVVPIAPRCVGPGTVMPLAPDCRCILRAGMKRAHEMAGSRRCALQIKSNPAAASFVHGKLSIRLVMWCRRRPVTEQARLHNGPDPPPPSPPLQWEKTRVVGSLGSSTGPHPHTSEMATRPATCRVTKLRAPKHAARKGGEAHPSAQVWEGPELGNARSTQRHINPAPLPRSP
jgi:hypothetical protein